jgi:DNA-directed RNA polymerase I, II, and III subunit RPABC3
MAGVAGDSQLFDETFTITSLDNSKYDRVARIGGTSGDSQTVMTLDINTDLYPCAIGEAVHIVLASSLALDGSKDDGRGWRDVGRSGLGGESTLADMFDYVCHGKIYKFEDGEDGQTM